MKTTTSNTHNINLLNPRSSFRQCDEKYVFVTVHAIHCTPSCVQLCRLCMYAVLALYLCFSKFP